MFGLETGTGSSSLPKSNILASLPMVPANTSLSLPLVETEFSLSLPAKCISNPMLISSNNEALDFSASLANEKSVGQWAPHDEKDEMIMKLVSKVRGMQNLLQEWTEWPNQKVMQATRRLGKNKAELKILWQDKEEVQQHKKEKQTWEENTRKKLSKMENALFKASGKVEQASAVVRRLEFENAALQRDMEAAKLHAAAAGSAASCQEVSENEKQTLMNFQSWEKQALMNFQSQEKQKTMFQEELAVELMQLQKELHQAKIVQDEAKARLKQKEILTQASIFRKEREQIETLSKSREDMMKSKAENNLQKCKDNIERLQKEISKLSLIADSSKIAALRKVISMDFPISYIMETYFPGLTGN